LMKARSRAGFLDERHVLITASETGHAAHGEAQRVLTSEIAPSNILLRVPSFIAGAIVASQTDGVVTLPANLADSIAGPLGLVAFKPPIALPRIEIAQFWHERYHRDAGHQWLRNLTFELFARAVR
jgi:DNA-binding transcriptional LysR family regulator